MCMGMMNYRKPKENLTVISCRKCGRSWQVTESDAKEFKENKEACAECRKKSDEKKVSLLKPYTNNDRINDMSIEDKAKFLFEVNNQDFAIYFCDSRFCGEVKEDVNTCSGNCQKAIAKWLESEVEE